MSSKRPETPQEEARRGNRMVEQMYGDMRIAKGMPEVNCAEPVRKVRAERKASGEPSEAQILKAIMQLLHRHPKVASAVRFNSGTFVKQYGDKTHYIRANTQKGMADIQGMLHGGRMYALEVKSRTGRVMEHQEAYLAKIRAGGGLAAVVRSVDDVVKLLEGI